MIDSRLIFIQNTFHTKFDTNNWSTVVIVWLSWFEPSRTLWWHLLLNYVAQTGAISKEVSNFVKRRLKHIKPVVYLELVSLLNWASLRTKAWYKNYVSNPNFLPINCKTFVFHSLNWTIECRKRQKRRQRQEWGQVG